MTTTAPTQFTYRVTDAAGLYSEAVISLTITPDNDPPVADEQELTTAEDTGLPIVLTASDPDLPEDELTFSMVSDPEHGAIVGSGDTWTYTPADDYHGPDQFTYRVGRRGRALQRGCDFPLRLRR